MIVTICGSTQFKDQINDVASKLALDGHIALKPDVFIHADNMDETLPTEQKIRLGNLHLQKIMMSDAIYVVNPNKYIGEHTYGHIDWANKVKKEIYFMEEMEKPEDVNEEKEEASQN